MLEDYDLIGTIFRLRDIEEEKRKLEHKLLKLASIGGNPKLADIVIKIIYDIVPEKQEQQQQDSKPKQQRKNRKQINKGDIARLRSMPYKEYLQTEHWQNVRRRALKTAKGRCQLCNENKKALDVHHKTYERKGREYRRDVIVLCRSCHEKFHDKLPSVNE